MMTKSYQLWFNYHSLSFDISLEPINFKQKAQMESKTTVNSSRKKFHLFSNVRLKLLVKDFQMLISTLFIQTSVQYDFLFSDHVINYYNNHNLCGKR
jgi:hypothetical protein